MSIGVVLLVFETIFIFVFGYASFNLLRKEEKLEDIIISRNQFISRLHSKVEEASSKLKEIDASGAFEADDEVGYFFNYLKELQIDLEEHILKSANEESEAEQ